MATNTRKVKITEVFCRHLSKQQVCFARHKLQTTDVKTKFSGLNSNIIYKAQISLFTCHVERNAVNRVAAAAVVVAGDAEVAALVSLVQSTFVSICLGLLVVVFAACSSTEQGFFVWSLASRCKQATKEVGAITAAAGGVLLYWL